MAPLLLLFHRALLTSLVVLTVANQLLLTSALNDELDKFRPYESFVELKGGEFLMGINDREGVNHEYPQRRAIVRPFRMMMYPVTIASFKRFRNEKYRHLTDAELAGFSWVFDKLMNPTATIHDSYMGDPHETAEALEHDMVPVDEARWNRPEGGNSTIANALNFPVVHVSFRDAFAYCTWRGMRLATEIEWEFATRGSLKEKVYPWGDHWEVGRTNLWQGKFPEENQLRDGHYGLAPVDAFKPQNDYDMYDMIGNTWEWTSTVFRNLHGKVEDDPGHRRVLKGGSFLDSRDAEHRKDKLKIRVSSRMGRTQTYTAQNVGFRCAQSIEDSEKVDFANNSHNVVRLRAPKHFGKKPASTTARNEL